MQRSSGIPTPKPAERDQPFMAFEQDYRELTQALAAPEPAAPAPDQTAEAMQPRPRQVERTSLDSNIPEPRSLFVRADDGPRSRWRGLMAAVILVAVGSAIAAGAYLHLRDRTSLDTIVPAAAPSGAEVDASPEPRIASEVAAAPESASAPTTRTEPEVRGAPAEPPVATDAEQAPAGAPAPTCPAAVEAMALCESFVRATAQ